MIHCFQGTGTKLVIRAKLTFLGLSLLLLAVPTTSFATDIGSIEAIVRGVPPAPGSPVVALCPDLTERPEVFLARGDQSLAAVLARSGYKVLLVDPWSAQAVSAEGFDALASEVYPALIEELRRRADGAQVTFVGHGLCGFVPIAAASASPASSAPLDWVAIGTRLHWTRPSPLLEAWVEEWLNQERPVSEKVKALFFTGLRESLGPRPSSIPESWDPSEEAVTSQMERRHRERYARVPSAGVLEDIRRWFREGRATARRGWLNYESSMTQVSGRGLILLGLSDPVAPPERSLTSPETFSSATSVRTQVLSRSEGYGEDYGHLGLLLSRSATRDGDRLIKDWLIEGRTK